MAKFDSYMRKNPVTRNLLCASVVFLLAFILINQAFFSGMEQGTVFGEIQSTHQKIYAGRSLGYENRAKLITSSGKQLIITCKTKCIEKSKVNVKHYKTIFGKDIYEYDGT